MKPTWSLRSSSSLRRGMSFSFVFFRASSYSPSYLNTANDNSIDSTSIANNAKQTTDLRHSSSHLCNSALISPISSWMKSRQVPKGPVCCTSDWMAVRIFSKSPSANVLAKEAPVVAAAPFLLVSAALPRRRPNRIPPPAFSGCFVSSTACQTTIEHTNQ